MNDQTSLFLRLPKDSGVTFSGFKDIKLSSRDAVSKQLKDFLNYCEEANSTAFRVILGEWGEGKTDAYHRYIYPESISNENKAFMISASSLSNSYDMENVKNTFETTSLSAIRFLTALFYCIREVEKEKTIPDLKDFESAESFLKHVLEALSGDSKKRIIIFIDEFEDLINLKEKINEIISGIKATINGQFKEIDEDGKFAGCLHLVVAATPDAFYQLEVSEETSLIFGGLGRRIGIIELPIIRKEEGMNFLLALLNYSYQGNIPEPFPTKTSGIFNIIYRITQGNPGVMVSLFTRLMSNAKENSHLRIIQAFNFLDFIKNEQIWVYGGNSSCLEIEQFNRMLRIIEDQRTRELGKKCSKILKLLTGELKPFSIPELQERTSYSERDIMNCINIINCDLKNRENIQRAIIRVSPLKKDLTFETIREVLKNWITFQKDKEWIKLGNHIEKIEEFQDKITFFELDEKKTVSKIILPCGNDSVTSFFEEIDSDTSTELANIFRRKLCTEEKKYLISEDFLSQVYFTPIPRGWEFIRDRDIKWKLWKQLRKDFSTQYVKHFPYAFLNILIESDLFNIEKINRLAANAIFCRSNIKEMGVNLFFFAVNGDVKSTDIEELNVWVKKTSPPIHCCVILHTGDFTEDAYDKIVNKGLGKGGSNLFVPIKLHPTLARRLIGIYRAQTDHPEVIDKNLLSSCIKRLVTQEINFQNKIETWIDSQVANGVVIKDLDIDATSNLREFAGALKFYINFSDKHESIENIFDLNQKQLLDNFVKYGSKIGLIPDIDLPKFRNLSKDLLINGFLGKDESIYRIQNHPVEKRILKILEEKTRLTEDELRDFFIYKSTRVLKDVFLPILEWKGLIQKENKDYKLSDVQELRKIVELEYQNISRQLDVNKRIWNYGHILFVKQKGERYITLKSFIEFINLLRKEIEELPSLTKKEISLQKLSLIRNIIDHFQDNFLHLFTNALEQGKQVIINLDHSFSEFDSRLKDIIDESKNWLKLEFKKDNISEYEKLLGLYNKIKEIEKFDIKETLEMIESYSDEEKKKFYFRKEDVAANHFNPKLYTMKNLKKRFDELIINYNGIVKDILDIFKNLNRDLSSIENRIRMLAIHEEYKLSTNVLEILKTCVRDILPQTEPMSYPNISLNQIKNRMDENQEYLKSYLDGLSGCLDQLRQLSDEEEQLLSKFESIKEFTKHVKWVFDSEDYVSYTELLASNNQEVRQKYVELSKGIVFEDVDTLSKEIEEQIKFLNNYRKKIIESESAINEAWNRYVKLTNVFISDITDFLEFIRKKESEIEEGDIENKLLDIKEKIEPNDVKDVAYRLSEIDEAKETVRRLFYEILSKTLTDLEISILQLILKVTKRGKSWLSTGELQRLATELDIESKDVKKALSKLLNAGYIQSGYSLTV